MNGRLDEEKKATASRGRTVVYQQYGHYPHYIRRYFKYKCDFEYLPTSPSYSHLPPEHLKPSYVCFEFVEVYSDMDTGSA